jgi:murein DD-endopeptidase MepM/ murein hydrolase activator NlpD
VRTRLSIILLLATVLLAGIPLTAHAAPSGPRRSGWFSASTVGVEQRVELVARFRHTERARLASVAKALTTPPPPPPPPPPATDPTSFIWPAHAPITSPFGTRWGRPHTGVDIDADYGTAIVAAQAGVVTLAGQKNGYGNTVIIDHGNGISTLYAHQSKLAVRTGQHVAQGQYIGNVGATGHVTAPHLHFEVLIGGVPRNPMPWLAGRH